MSRPCSDHVLTHIRDALATDGRVGELGLEVRCLARDGYDEIVIGGAVSTAERKSHVVEVAAEMLAELEMDCVVVDDTVLTPVARPEPGATETL